MLSLLQQKIANRESRKLPIELDDLREVSETGPPAEH
jgi:hypothetical protein